MLKRKACQRLEDWKRYKTKQANIVSMEIYNTFATVLCFKNTL